MLLWCVHKGTNIAQISNLNPIKKIWVKELASYHKADATFTFHFSILTLSSINRGMKSESDFSVALASQPFECFCAIAYQQFFNI